MKLRLFIFGTGAHARKVYHYAIGSSHVVAGFVDENPAAPSPVPGFKVWPARQLLAPAEGDAIFVAIGKPDVRKRLLDLLEQTGWNCPALVHPSASVAPDAVIETGVLIGAGAVIETGTSIGRGAIVDVGVIVDHDCQIGSFCHLKPGEVFGSCTKVRSPLEQV